MRAIKHLEQLLKTIVSDMGYALPAKIAIEPPKDKQFGDLAVNVAMVLAKEVKKSPRLLAEELAAALNSSSEHIATVEIAGPGFINVTFSPVFWQETVRLVEGLGAVYGSSGNGKGKKVNVEYVSANPTGPLHIGHGRGAAIGDSLVRILKFAGYDTVAEYYINDAGKQMHTLGRSIRMRALELEGKSTGMFPEDCYQGEYIVDIAREMLAANPGFALLPDDEGINACYRHGMRVIFDEIKRDLKDFRVHHDIWFSELSLVNSGQVEKTLQKLKESGIAYEHEGALWFRTTDYGDDKDRVLRKSDGSLTYFASDIAYHADKYERGHDWCIDIWGADHHGYIPRMRAAVDSIGRPKESFDVILVQLVNLLRDGEQIAMSTRAGQYETLADVIKEVGTDAARFMFLSRKSDSKLDFDLELVKQRTMDNPVYYVQYAHARIKAVLRRAAERGIGIDGPGDLSLLQQEEELDLLRMLDRFPLVTEDAAKNLATHFISYYLMDLAGLLHRYYSVHVILGPVADGLTLARLRLIRAVGQAIANGLELLGVSAPESM